MKYQGEELVRVRSESELRAGMTVVTRQCFHCGKCHARLLFKHPGKITCRRCRRPGWDAAGGCDGSSRCFCRAIEEGRLYRLRDEQKTDEKTRTREAEGTR